MFKKDKELAMTSINEDMLFEELTQRGNSSMDNTSLVSNIVNVPGARVVSQCVLRAGTSFFLIVELAVNSTMGTELTRVVVIAISADLAARLLASGVSLCTVQTTVPPSTTGLSPACTLVVGNTAYIIFLVPNVTNRIVVVTSPLCTVI